MSDKMFPPQLFVTHNEDGEHGDYAGDPILMNAVTARSDGEGQWVAEYRLVGKPRLLGARNRQQECVVNMKGGKQVTTWRTWEESFGTCESRQEPAK